MEENCSNCVEAKLKEETLAMAQKYENHKENLIAILNDVQEEVNDFLYLHNWRLAGA